MKSIVLTLTIFFTCLFSTADTFEITNIYNGKMYSNKHVLVKNQTITDKTPLRFSSDKAIVYLKNRSKHFRKYTIKASAFNKKKSKTLGDFLKPLKPNKQRMQTRIGADSEFLKDYLGDTIYWTDDVCIPTGMPKSATRRFAIDIVNNTDSVLRTIELPTEDKGRIFRMPAEHVFGKDCPDTLNVIVKIGTYNIDTDRTYYEPLSSKILLIPLPD